MGNWKVTVIDGKEYLVHDVTNLRIPLELDPNPIRFGITEAINVITLDPNKDTL